MWPLAGVSLVALAVLLLAAPARFEGPVLLPVSPGHALSVLDSVAVIPLLIGFGSIYGGLWQRRESVYEVLSDQKGRGVLFIFLAGMGFGLLIASAFSTFWWWWAFGALLFTSMLMLGVVAAARRRPIGPGTERSVDNSEKRR